MKTLLKYGLISVVVSFFSCERKVSRYVCDCEQREKMSAFITDNMKSANNMSDEEMEDVIKELRNTSIMLYCSEKDIIVDFDHRPIISKNNLDSCEVVVRWR